MKRVHWAVGLALLMGSMAAAAGPNVRMMRVPEGGIQPQVVVDQRGVVHLLYYKGHEARGDLFYVKSEDGGGVWSSPVRVNSQAGSGLSIGTIRGAHIAVGRNGRVHVAWMGSDRAEPKPPGGKGTPMLYARMNDAGTGFEPQRNVISQKVGLDGGGSVAADGLGTVYVAWHAPATAKAGEENRTVWVARSSDEGKTFEREKKAWEEPTGACGCCGMRMFADANGGAYILYRSATEMVHRDIYLLMAKDGMEFTGKKVGQWEIGKCVMSSASFAPAKAGAVAAWESQDQVFWAKVDAATGKVGEAIAPPGRGNNRKHPAAAVNSAGQQILVWTEETGWNKGGKVAWQVFDAEGKPVENASGKIDGLPVWSMGAVFANGDGFVIVY
ncbi:MAG TPA: sialidase family protein [Tepidisphaeraceae bacterium]|jgi:hypothetical protein|nr:sialidase family protein [Tepidisphaeraceae bacterium]